MAGKSVECAACQTSKKEKAKKKVLISTWIKSKKYFRLEKSDFIV